MFATEGEIPKGYYDAIDRLPNEISDKLPEGIYSDNIDEVKNSAEELMSAEYLFSFFSELLSTDIGEAIALLGKICGLLVLSSVFSAIKTSITSSALAAAFEFCTTCSLFAAFVSMLITQINAVSLFFERLNSLMLGFIPITCAVWAMGGNVGTAASAGGTLYVFLGFCEFLCAKAIIPVSSLCVAFALCRGVSPSINFSGFSSALKKCYTFLLGLIMTVLLAVLSTQTILTTASDSVAARGAKMITATVIPVVGGAVSETLRTLGASVQYIKSVVGVSAIAMIILLLLPTLISLLVTRFVYILSGSVADLLGCERESKLIGDIGGVYGLMIAAVSMASVMFILGLNIFIRSTVAVGG